VQLGFVKNLMCQIPRHRIKKLQDRALRQLHERIKGLPEMSVDRHFVEFTPKEKTKQTLKVFTVTNNSAKERVNYHVSMDESELYRHSRYSFTFEPSEFSLDKVLLLLLLLLEFYATYQPFCACLICRQIRNNRKLYA
jgi:hypothetical protein